MISTGATGKLIVGDVLDVNKTSLEAKLRDYDAKLYLKWNATKRRGYGCWEVRRAPDKKSIVDIVEYKGNSYCRVDYHEIDLVNHVLDVDYLNYNVLTKLKQMDLWSQMTNNNSKSVSYWIDRLENEEKAVKEKEQAHLRQERNYALSQQKRAIREFKEKILSGVNPNLLAKFWK